MQITVTRRAVVSAVLLATTITSAGVPVDADHTPAPTTVTVAGSLQAELGCPGEWQPDCAATALQPVAGQPGVFSATFDVPAGTYAFKVAVGGSWDENYGDGGRLNGSNIPYEHDGGPITFLYDHRTHHVSNTAMSDVLVLTGDFQSEVGCTAGDGQPDCLATWLQDRDGDGTYVFRTAQIPAGTYQVQVARNGTATGAALTFTVPADGSTTRFTYDAAAGDLQVTTEV